MKIKLLNAVAALMLLLLSSPVFAQAPTLGSAANFVLFSTAGAVTNSGIPHLTHLTGHVGTNSGSSTGFGNVDGGMHDGDGVSGTAATDLGLAYNQLNAAIPTFFRGPLLGNGDTLLPGVYRISSAATMNLNLILNAQGNPGSVFIFQIQGSLSTNAFSKVKLINGGLACNVFWKVEGLVSMATGTTMRGTIVAHNAAINMSPLDTLEGRALSIAGAVTTNAVLAYTPIGCGSSVLMGPMAPAMASTAAYGIFTSVGPVANSGLTHVVGDVGTNSGLTTGFNPLFVTGMIHPIPDASTAAAAADLTNVYNYLNTLPIDIELLYPAQFGYDLVLTPHTYLLNAAPMLTDKVYLNAQGFPNAVFVIHVNGAFNTSVLSRIMLINGAQAKNVYWLVNGATHIYDNSVFNGTIIGAGAITFNTGDTLNGRALTKNGAVGTSGSYFSSATPAACVAPPIGGSLSVCPAATTTLTNADAGGIWSSSNPLVAIVGSSSGIVTGISPGTSTITYTTPAACESTAIVTVNTSPAPIVGPGGVCVGNTITMTDITPGGTWSSSNTAEAIVGSASGIVTGIAAGTPTISYSVPGTCAATKTIAVGAYAGEITGPSSVCIGSVIILSDTVIGGAWSASNTHATVIGGVVTGITAGIDTIMYMVTNLCGTDTATRIIAVDSTPGAGVITGPSSVCVGSAITLADTTSGGVWTTSNANAMVVSGVVTGLLPGTVNINYTVINACGTATATKSITVNPLPDEGSISGPSSVCVGSSITLTESVTGGSWGASNATATVAGGVVNGVSAGIDTIYYSVTNSCGTATASKTIAVNPLPNAGTITGPSTVCTGSTITLSDTAPGGVWSSSNANATVVGGVVTGLLAGTVNISYTVVNVCGTATATKLLTVNPSPDAGIISGPSSVCVGSSITLTESVTGGSWGASNANALVSGGIVTGVSAGTDTIYYSVTNSCGTATASKTIVINPLPNAGTISGPSEVCVGTLITLTDVVTGGIWSASNPHATVVGGIVMGMTPGVDTIRYTYTNVCGTDVATKVVTVNPQPFAGTISGLSDVCVGSSIMLTASEPLGTWSSSNTSAIVSGGMVTGLAEGVDTISYAVTNMCGTATATKIVNVHATPDAGAITGASSVCVGSSITLSNAVTGGVWSKTNNNVALSGSLVIGITPGIDTIMYTVSTAFCSATVSKVIVINPLPDAGAISGSSVICIGIPIPLTATIAGGTWSSSNNFIALVSITGIVSGVSTGVATISYSVANFCGTDVATKTITVSPIPAVPVISTQSPAIVCMGTMYQNFGAATLPPANTTYKWTATNAVVWAQGTAHQYALVNFNTPGTAVVTLSATTNGSGCTSSASTSVIVSANSAPSPTVSYFNNHFVCTPADMGSYQWGYDNTVTLDSTVLGGEINQDYLNTSPDFYGKNYWCMTTLGGCAQKTYYHVPTGVQNVTNGDASITVFPNPADATINVAVAATITGTMQVEVSNLLGQKLSTVQANDNKATIDVSALPAGYYLVACFHDGVKIAATRFIKN